MTYKRPTLRKCIGCFSLKDKNELLRVYRSDDDRIMTDPTGKSGHRGAYICKDSTCVALARKRKALERSFKMKISDEDYDRLVKGVSIYDAG